MSGFVYVQNDPEAMQWAEAIAKGHSATAKMLATDSAKQRRMLRMMSSRPDLLAALRQLKTDMQADAKKKEEKEKKKNTSSATAPAPPSKST
jgi:hypothetical protein